MKLSSHSHIVHLFSQQPTILQLNNKNRNHKNQNETSLLDPFSSYFLPGLPLTIGDLWVKLVQNGRRQDSLLGDIFSTEQVFVKQHPGTCSLRTSGVLSVTSPLPPLPLPLAIFPLPVSVSASLNLRLTEVPCAEQCLWGRLRDSSKTSCQSQPALLLGSSWA